MCVFCVHECVFKCALLYEWSLCHAANYDVHVVCVLLCMCGCCVWMGYVYRWCMCGSVSLYQIRTQSHPILKSLPNMQLAYWILVSDIIFSLFSSFSHFSGFQQKRGRGLNSSQRQHLISQYLLLAHFFVIDFKFKQCAEAEQCTSTNAVDAAEGGQHKERCTFWSWD